MDLLESYQPQERAVIFRATQGAGGLGDRVMGAISAFVLALLTNRQFRIDWRTPLPLDAAWEPSEPQRIPWNQLHAGDRDPRVIASVCRLPEMAPFFSQEDFRTASWTEHDWIVEANQHFFSYLFTNPSLANAAGKMVDRNHAEITADVMSFLFAPSAQLLERLACYLRRLDGKTSLGLQVRTLWNWGDGGGRLTDDEFSSLVDCTIERMEEKARDMVFVTADDARVFGQLRKRIGSIPMFWLSRPIVHLDRSSAQNADDFLDVFANFHLLAACNELVISHWSNFGRLAALWGQRATWITHKSGDIPDLPFGDARWRQAELDELVSKETLVRCANN